jgi:hypothetical protein
LFPQKFIHVDGDELFEAPKNITPNSLPKGDECEWAKSSSPLLSVPNIIIVRALVGLFISSLCASSHPGFFAHFYMRKGRAALCLK